VDEEIDETSDIGKKKSIIIELKEIAYIEIILPIDVKASSGKVAFKIIRGCMLEISFTFKPTSDKDIH
jgi:hypothetical protein